MTLIFVVDVDEALASGVMATDAAATTLFPLHYPHAVFQAAVDGRIPDVADVLAAGTYGLVVLAATFLVYTALAETDETHALAPFLPGHFPMKLAFDAALTARVRPANLWFSLAYLCVLALVVAAAFRRAIRVD